MLALDPWFLAVAAPAVIFAGISKGGFGSGAAFAGSSILALVVPPGMALGVMLPLLMLMDLANLRPYWRKWAWPETRLLIWGGLPGVGFGVLLYSYASDDALRLLIGVISVAFVLWQMGVARGIIRLGRVVLPDWAGGLAGFVAGFTSFVSHAGGPPAAVFLLSRGLSKTTYQASTVLTFWAINIAKFFPYALLGVFSAETTAANIVLAPFALLGAWLGVKAHHLVSERAFFAFTYCVLMVTGVKLIFDGLT